MRPRPHTVLGGMVLGMAGNAMGYGRETAVALPAVETAAEMAAEVERPEVIPSAPRPALVPPDPTPQPPPEPEGPCPPGMAHINRYCIDRYEAHLVTVEDGREERHPHQLRPRSKVRYEARSAPGVFPQAYISFHEAKAACQNAGKRLCSWLEWRRACQGPKWQRYPYGHRLKMPVCNVGKKHLLGEMFGENKKRWTHEMFNDPRLNIQPGYLAQSGDYQDCASPDGVYDMVGNLHEWVNDQLGRALLRKLDSEKVKRASQPYRLGNGVFLGGFYSTVGEHGSGCYFVTYAHEQRYHDYSTGFRCCADAKDEVER